MKAEKIVTRKESRVSINHMFLKKIIIKILQRKTLQVNCYILDGRTQDRKSSQLDYQNGMKYVIILNLVNNFANCNCGKIHPILV